VDRVEVGLARLVGSRDQVFDVVVLSLDVAERHHPVVTEAHIYLSRCGLYRTMRVV
jgi:hypothetical protein